MGSFFWQTPQKTLNLWLMCETLFETRKAKGWLCLFLSQLCWSLSTACQQAKCECVLSVLDLFNVFHFFFLYCFFLYSIEGSTAHGFDFATMHYFMSIIQDPLLFSPKSVNYYTSCGQSFSNKINGGNGQRCCADANYGSESTPFINGQALWLRIQCWAACGVWHLFCALWLVMIERGCM